jgi:5-methylcytosine-specific restriction endonuclease McrA
VTRRGTTNGNARGNTRDREARRLWLLKTWQSDCGSSYCRCYRCGDLLLLHQITVDRIIPGAKGGTYRRNNIRPACARCNSETGGAVRR